MSGTEHGPGDTEARPITVDADVDTERDDLEDEDEDEEPYEPPEPAAIPFAEEVSTPGGALTSNAAPAAEVEARSSSEEVSKLRHAGGNTHGKQALVGAGDRFTAYVSPLLRNAATQAHPEFCNRELCQFEGAGGVCNDAQCQYLHFRDLLGEGESC